jgi:hypothetical protein
MMARIVETALSAFAAAASQPMKIQPQGVAHQHADRPRRIPPTRNKKRTSELPVERGLFVRVPGACVGRLTGRHGGVFCRRWREPNDRIMQKIQNDGEEEERSST